MNEYSPKIQGPVTDTFIPGQPVYDKAAKLWVFLEALGRGVYQATSYQEFNPYFALISDNLNMTIRQMDEFDREEFEEIMLEYSPKDIMRTEEIYEEKPKDWEDFIKTKMPNPEPPAMIPVLDKDGKQVLDDDGEPVFKQDLDNYEEEITVETPNEFIPKVVGTKEVPTGEKDWEGYLIDLIVDAGGWAYQPDVPVVPFLKDHMASYHYKNLLRYFRNGGENAATIIERTKSDVK